MLNSKMISFTIAWTVFRLTAADPYASMDTLGKLPDNQGNRCNTVTASMTGQKVFPI